MFAYFDAGLANNLGHHANSARNIVSEVRSRGIPCAVLGHMGLEQGLQAELAATPWFRCHTYGIYDQDPICGWLTNHELVARVMAEDLGRLQDVSSADLVYVNSVQPAQFMGVVRWAQSLPAETRPQVIMEFGTDPGLIVYDTPNGIRFSPHDTRVDARAVLLRHTARHLTEADREWLKLATFDSQSSGIFQMLLDFPVGTLPLPQQAVTSCRDRTGKRPVVIGILGHQRGEKGYDKVPALAERLLAEHGDDIRLLVHNGDPDGMPKEQQALRDIAARDRRLVMEERTADAVLWAALLELTDLIVCPYNRNRFISSYSAVASEAMANAIPLVVPDGTTMHAVIREFGEPGTTFNDESVDGIHAAVNAALGDFDRLARLAKLASQRWGETRGAKCLVDTLLSWQTAA